VLGATDAVSGLIEELQWTLGEGPCIDAHRGEVTVIEPDLAAPERSRWPAFTPPALHAGVAAIFGFPLRVGDARFGALDLYRDRAGPLSDEQLADALIAADVVAQAIVGMQGQAAPGTVAAGIETDADFRFVVHRAAGMVSVQLGVSVADALIRLRASAFSTGRSVTDLAEDVVNRRVRFEGPPWGQLRE
jgi:hypothetical protein